MSSFFERQRAENRKEEHGGGKENPGLLSLTPISDQAIELRVHTQWILWRFTALLEMHTTLGHMRMVLESSPGGTIPIFLSLLRNTSLENLVGSFLIDLKTVRRNVETIPTFELPILTRILHVPSDTIPSVAVLCTVFSIPDGEPKGGNHWEVTIPVGDFILLIGGTMEVEVDDHLKIEIIGQPVSIFIKLTGPIYMEWDGEDNHFAISGEYALSYNGFELLLTNERMGICVSNLTLA